jgi:hypothetical protein
VEKIEQLPKNFAIRYKPPFSPEVNDRAVTIRFYADGSSNGGLIEMASKEAVHRISIDWLTGRVGYDEKS